MQMQNLPVLKDIQHSDNGLLHQVAQDHGLLSMSPQQLIQWGLQQLWSYENSKNHVQQREKYIQFLINSGRELQQQATNQIGALQQQLNATNQYKDPTKINKADYEPLYQELRLTLDSRTAKQVKNLALTAQGNVNKMLVQYKDLLKEIPDEVAKYSIYMAIAQDKEKEATNKKSTQLHKAKARVDFKQQMNQLQLQQLQQRLNNNNLLMSANNQQMLPAANRLRLLHPVPESDDEEDLSSTAENDLAELEAPGNDYEDDGWLDPSN